MYIRKSIQIVAAIDIGSNYIRMSIAEITDESKFYMLEDLIKASNIGKEIFSSGNLSIKTINETCNILKGFSQLMKDYRIRNYRAVSTTGLRECENNEYIIDYIRLKTGINVEIINTAQERFLSYKALRYHLPESSLLGSDSSLIINVTSGGIEVSLYKEGNLNFTEYIKLGSLRLREILADLEPKTMDFPGVMEEFIESKIYLLKSTIENLGVKNFIGLGGELSTIWKLCNNNSNKKDNVLFIKKDDLYKLYGKMHNMNNDQIMHEYGVSRKEAEILLPSVILFQCFLKLTKAKGIHAPITSLRHGILYDMLDEFFHVPGKEKSYTDIISSVWYIAEKYKVDKNHASFVEKISLSIFDQTQRLHKFSDRERLYLRIAAILHDTGNYVHFSEHAVHTYNIIRIRNIMGLSDKELILIANIARYHSYDMPRYDHENYMILNDTDKIIVSKLAAILTLAESLDISHRQKITELKISVSSDKLYFNIQSNMDTILEEWDFMNNAPFFQKVMGITPEIKHKG